MWDQINIFRKKTKKLVFNIDQPMLKTSPLLLCQNFRRLLCSEESSVETRILFPFFAPLASFTSSIIDHFWMGGGGTNMASLKYISSHRGMPPHCTHISPSWLFIEVTYLCSVNIMFSILLPTRNVLWWSPISLWA